MVNHMVLIARDGSRTAVTSKMVSFVIIVNSQKPLTIITKRSNLDVAAALDLPLIAVYTGRKKPLFFEKLDPSLNSKIKQHDNDISKAMSLKSATYEFLHFEFMPKSANDQNRLLIVFNKFCNFKVLLSSCDHRFLTNAKMLKW